nr:unnamed protein product [Digitaria exilis]
MAPRVIGSFLWFVLGEAGNQQNIKFAPVSHSPAPLLKRGPSRSAAPGGDGAGRRRPGPRGFAAKVIAGAGAVAPGAGGRTIGGGRAAALVRWFNPPLKILSFRARCGRSDKEAVPGPAHDQNKFIAAQAHSRGSPVLRDAVTQGRRRRLACCWTRALAHTWARGDRRARNLRPAADAERRWVGSTVPYATTTPADWLVTVTQPLRPGGIDGRSGPRELWWKLMDTQRPAGLKKESLPARISRPVKSLRQRVLVGALVCETLGGGGLVGARAQAKPNHFAIDCLKGPPAWPPDTAFPRLDLRILDSSPRTAFLHTILLFHF